MPNRIHRIRSGEQSSGGGGSTKELDNSSRAIGQKHRRFGCVSNGGGRASLVRDNSNLWHVVKLCTWLFWIGHGTRALEPGKLAGHFGRHEDVFFGRDELGGGLVMLDTK